jgi:hypothetical protein
MVSALPNVSALIKIVFQIKYAKKESVRGFVAPEINAETSKSVSIECAWPVAPAAMIVPVTRYASKINVEILVKIIHRVENVPNALLRPMKYNVLAPLDLAVTHLPVAFLMTKNAPLIRPSKTG